MFFPDPNFSLSRIQGQKDSGSRIWIRIKEFEVRVFLTRKNVTERSEIHDPGCSSRIPDPYLDFYPSRIRDQGVKKAPDSGSRIRKTLKAVYQFLRKYLP
jgi:hypothetical protein